MPVTADVVEDHARNPDVWVMLGKARNQGHDGSGHLGGINDQDDGKAQDPRQIRNGSLPIGWSAVKQPHGPFNNQRGVACGKGPDPIRSHGPGVKVQAFCTRCGGVKARVNIVRAGLRGSNSDPLTPQEAQQAERDRCFAGPAQDFANLLTQRK